MPLGLYTGEDQWNELVGVAPAPAPVAAPAAAPVPAPVEPGMYEEPYAAPGQYAEQAPAAPVEGASAYYGGETSAAPVAAQAYNQPEIIQTYYPSTQGTSDPTLRATDLTGNTTYQSQADAAHPAFSPTPVAQATGNPNTAGASQYYGAGAGEEYQRGYVAPQAVATPYIEPGATLTDPAPAAPSYYQAARAVSPMGDRGSTTSYPVQEVAHARSVIDAEDRWRNQATAQAVSPLSDRGPAASLFYGSDMDSFPPTAPASGFQGEATPPGIEDWTTIDTRPDVGLGDMAFEADTRFVNQYQPGSAIPAEIPIIEAAPDVTLDQWRRSQAAASGVKEPDALAAGPPEIPDVTWGGNQLIGSRGAKPAASPTTGGTQPVTTAGIDVGWPDLVGGVNYWNRQWFGGDDQTAADTATAGEKPAQTQPTQSGGGGIATYVLGPNGQAIPTQNAAGTKALAEGGVSNNEPIVDQQGNPVGNTVVVWDPTSSTLKQAYADRSAYETAVLDSDNGMVDGVLTDVEVERLYKGGTLPAGTDPEKDLASYKAALVGKPGLYPVDWGDVISDESLDSKDLSEVKPSTGKKTSGTGVDTNVGATKSSDAVAGAGPSGNGGNYYPSSSSGRSNYSGGRIYGGGSGGGSGYYDDGGSGGSNPFDNPIFARFFETLGRSNPDWMASIMEMGSRVGSSSGTSRFSGRSKSRRSRSRSKTSRNSSGKSGGDTGQFPTRKFQQMSKGS